MLNEVVVEWFTEICRFQNTRGVNVATPRSDERWGRKNIILLLHMFIKSVLRIWLKRLQQTRILQCSFSLGDALNDTRNKKFLSS